MYRLIAAIILLGLLSACAAGNTRQSVTHQQKEIALAEHRLGESYYGAGNYVEALRKFLEAEKILPDNEYIQNSLGMVYMVRNRYDLAQKHFEKALKINPEYYVAKNHLGASLMKQEKWEPAIQCFEELSGNLLYATPENPLTNLGWIYLEKKEYTTARKYFLQALDVYPCFVVATHGLATIYIELTQYDEAVRMLEKCVERFPEAAILYADLARTYEAARDYEKSREYWQIVKRLSPVDSVLAREAEQKIN